MKKTVFIAEKADVARHIISYYKNEWGDNVSENYESDLKVTTLSNGEEMVILAPLSGHLLKLKQMKEYEEGKNLSWAKVILSKKPFVPEEFQFTIRAGDTNRREAIDYPKRVIGRIAQIIVDANVIINAGDSDEEGQFLVDEVIDYLKTHNKYRSQAEYKRIFIHSTEVKGIRKAIKDAIPNERVYNLGLAARGRSIADWLWGANMTVIATELLGHEFKTVGKDGKPKNALLSVGRVQTPVLNLIYEREQLIKNFKESVFYNIEATMEKGEDTEFKGDLNLKQPDLYDELERANELDSDGRLISRDRAQFLCNRFNINGQYPVGETNKTNSKEYAPLPLSIEELQKRMSRIHKVPANETLDAAQKLYMAQLITYPRNNGARYLPVELQNDIADTFEAITALNDPIFNSGLEIADQTNLSSKAWNDSKVESHYAIIPTAQVTREKLAQHSHIERLVYAEVVKFYLYMFMLPAQKTSIKATVHHDTDKKLEIGVSMSTYIELGYRQAFGEFNNELGKKLPDLNKGDMVIINAMRTREGKTTPPKLFTSATLIDEMTKAYKYVDDPILKARLSGDIEKLTEEEQHYQVTIGIGTSATRASILTRLIELNYVQVNKSTDEYTTTPRAAYLLGNLPPFLKRVDTTAEWQVELDDVRHGNMTLDSFIHKQIRQLNEVFTESAENLGNAIGYFDRKIYRFNEVTTENVKECPICKVGMMNKVEWDDDQGIHKTEHQCKNQSCNYCEDVFNGIAYPKANNVESPHSCPECKIGKLFYSSGFSFRTAKPYSMLKCNNESCGKVFSADDKMNIIMRKGGTPTTHKCYLCNSTLNELKGVRKESGKQYHFFICSSQTCEGKLSAKADGTPSYPTNEPCPNCGGALFHIQGVSKKGNEYNGFVCNNDSCKGLFFPANVQNRPTFNFSDTNCYKCGSKMQVSTIHYNDKQTGEAKSFMKAACINNKCKSEYFVDPVTKKPVNPYERRLVKDTQRYTMLLQGSECPQCRGEVSYNDWAAGVQKTPYYRCDKCKIFLIQENGKFVRQQEKK